MATRLTRLVLIVAGGAAVSLGFTGASGPAQTTAPAPVLRTDTIARVAHLRTPSVVFLHTLSEGAPEPASLGSALTPTQQPPRHERPIQEGLGSGVIIDASGLILTNAHVIRGSSRLD